MLPSKSGNGHNGRIVRPIRGMEQEKLAASALSVLGEKQKQGNMFPSLLNVHRTLLTSGASEPRLYRISV